LGEGVPIIRPQTQNLLLFFLELTQPERILEIGTGVGFSALVMESALPAGGQITTIEKDSARAAKAQEHFRQFGAGPERIRLFKGDAQQVLEERLPEEEEGYDLIFLDGAKGQYVSYLPLLLSLLKPGGILISDNILKDGEILESRYAVVRRDRTIHRRMLTYLDELCHSDVLRTILLETGDGMAVSVKKR
ncbi:MAG: O-methyltransferase, partial [Lachnospiraceae bacterium]|nr:O-methyltransferase [Lachnospiraceae bacterium]